VTARLRGSIRVVRTFRVTLDGQLLAVTGAGADPATLAAGSGYAWTDGQNHASCRRVDHAGPVPGQDCTCGFYGFASDGTLRRSVTEGAHDLAAVIAVSGRVIPARRGVRAQHAQIQALWLSPRAGADLAARIAARYPSVAVFRDRQAMLGEFPPTRLPGYRLRCGPSRLLLAGQLLLAAVWIAATAASSTPSSPAPPGTTAAVLLPAAAGAGVGVVIALRRSWRYWAGSLALPAVLLAAGFIAPGLAGEAVAGAAVLGNLAGVVVELCLFAVTYCRLGRGLRVADPHRQVTSTWRARADRRPAGLRLLVLFAVDLLTASATGAGPTGLRPSVLCAAAVVTVLLTAVLARREAYRQHRLGLGTAAAGLLLGKLASAFTSTGTPTASSQAIGSAAMLLLVAGVALYWVEPIWGGRSTR